jgi:hypothetical protein
MPPLESLSTSSFSTAFARLTPWQARAVLLALALLVLFCLAWAMPSPPPVCNVREEGSKTGDVALYRAEVDRIHNGEPYYNIAAEELPERGYPTRSVFNWRTPLPMWLIGNLPAVVLGKAVLCGLGLLVLVLGFEIAAREEPRVYRRAVPLAILLIAPLLPCFLGDLFCMPVLWAGVLIMLSLCAYGLNRPYLGATAGLAAVFFRELALPYCLLGAALAGWQRRRGELAVWLVGLAGWAAFYGLHWWRVSQLITPDAEGHRQGWVQFVGMAFVLATTQMNSCLLLMPMWITVLYFAAAMLGLAGWHTPMGLRTALTVCLFAVAFSIVGQDFNRYWGLLYTLPLCFGAVRAPVSLAELWEVARARRHPMVGLVPGHLSAFKIRGANG